MTAELRQRSKQVAEDGAAPAPSEATNKGPAVTVDPAIATTLPDEQDFLTRHEAYVPYGLALLAGFTRFYRLDQPPGASLAGREMAAWPRWQRARAPRGARHPWRALARRHGASLLSLPHAAPPPRRRV